MTALLATDATKRAVDTIHILAVLPSSAEYPFIRLMSHTHWELRVVHTIAEATEELRSGPPPVLICEAELPDGTWIDMLRRAEQVLPRPTLVVTSSGADDRLWADVLNRGAYDLVTRPFEPRELYNTITAAFHHLKLESARREDEQADARVNGKDLRADARD